VTWEGRRLGKNTIYLIEMEGLHLCHLGDLGYLLSSSEVEDLGRLDVLFLPVGGGGTLNGVVAAETVRRLAPRLAIPMHYRSEARPELEPLERFLKELGQQEASPRPRLSVIAGNLPEKTEVVVLEHPLTP
jgi:L-ascorbate metabolism protein UlaG (beta-lactamase superfamily)